MHNASTWVTIVLRYKARTQRRVVGGQFFLSFIERLVRGGRVLHVSAFARPPNGYDPFARLDVEEPVWTWDAERDTVAEPLVISRSDLQLILMDNVGAVNLGLGGGFGRRPSLALMPHEMERLRVWIVDWQRRRR